MPSVVVVCIAPTIGDAAIGVGAVDELLDHSPDLRMTVLTPDPEAFSELAEDPRVRIVHGTLRIGPRRRPRLRPSRIFDQPWCVDGWNHVVHWGSRHGLLFLSDRRRREKVKSLLRDHDLLLYQGGPTWNDRFLGETNLLERLRALEIARRLGVRVALFGQSFGPFDWPGPVGNNLCSLVRACLKRVDLAVARDEFSLPSLERLGGVHASTVRASDTAICMKPTSAAHRDWVCRAFGLENPPVKEAYAVVFRSFQHSYEVPKEVEKRAHHELRTLVERLRNAGKTILLIPTDYRTFPDRPSDVEVLEDLFREAGKAESLVLLREPMSARQLKAVLSMCRAVVTMRLHPAILALSENVPACLISYDAKCADFMATLGLSNWCLPLDTFRADSTCTALDALLAAWSETVGAQVAEQMRSLRDSVHAATDQVASLLDRRKERPAGGPQRGRRA